MIFITNSFKQAKNSNLNMKPEMKNRRKMNPQILDSDGNPYKLIRELTRVGIFSRKRPHFQGSAKELQ